jgi:hypothetical protein
MLRACGNEGRSVPNISCFYEELPIRGIGEVSNDKKQDSGLLSQKLYHEY